MCFTLESHVKVRVMCVLHSESHAKVRVMCFLH